VRRVLRPGFPFIFAITHPCFNTSRARWTTWEGRPAREVSAYFEERIWQSDNPDGVRGKVGEHHRMLSTYLNALLSAGFSLERLAEPLSTGERAQTIPGTREIPTILAVRASITLGG
jgi:hypothetical protein